MAAAFLLTAFLLIGLEVSLITCGISVGSGLGLTGPLLELLALTLP